MAVVKHIVIHKAKSGVAWIGKIYPTPGLVTDDGIRFWEVERQAQMIFDLAFWDIPVVTEDEELIALLAGKKVTVRKPGEPLDPESASGETPPSSP